MRRPEQTIHRAVLDHIRWRGIRDLMVWHTPNGGARSRTEAAIFKSLGVHPGVADLLLLAPDGRFYSLELKAHRGRSTAAQTAWQADVNRNKGFACIANGLDEALHVLEVWGLIRSAKS